MRTLIGKALSRDFFAKRDLSRYEDMLQRRGLLAIILLHLNPLTSSDIVSYAAGLTSIPAATVMVGTLFGMAPLCYIQAYLSMELIVMFPWLLWPLIIAVVVYALVAVSVILKLKDPRIEELG